MRACVPYVTVKISERVIERFNAERSLSDGVDIGFVFQNAANFEIGLTEFSKANPAVQSWFGDFLRTQRKNWQNELSHFRNHFLEHRREEPEKFVDFYKPENAEALFVSVWRTTADILVTLLATRLRFRWVIPGLQPAKP